jgi:hypothetical protein
MSEMPGELRRWVEEPGCVEPGQRPGDAAGLRERKQPRFAKFCALPQSGLIIDVLWHYLRQVPRYAGSERSAWSLSCLPGTSRERLAVVSMRTMEVIVAGPSSGFLVVSEDALMRGPGGWDGFAARHPGLTAEDSRYRDAGGDQVVLRGSMQALHDAVTDGGICLAIRTLTARVYCLGQTIHGRGHCPQLADLVLDQANPDCAAGADRARRED